MILNVKRCVEERMSGVGDVECHTAVDPGSLERNECGSVPCESCWGEIEDINEDEDVEWGTLLTFRSHRVRKKVPHRLCCVRPGAQLTWSDGLATCTP